MGEIPGGGKRAECSWAMAGPARAGPAIGGDRGVAGDQVGPEGVGGRFGAQYLWGAWWEGPEQAMWGRAGVEKGLSGPGVRVGGHWAGSASLASSWSVGDPVSPPAFCN